MATEVARFTMWGMAIGVVVFGILFGYVWFTAPHYTDEQKIEVNAGFAPNCTACLVKENTSCTADTLTYSSFGVICDLKYVKNCTAVCRRV